MSMAQYVLRCLGLAGALAALPCPAPAQPADEAGPPRTPWGVPDLQGTWSLPTMTPLERPAELEDRLRLTEEEEAEFLATRRRGIRQGLARSLNADFELGGGGVDQSIYDHPLLDGRTSLVVSPENGRIPRTEEGRYRVGMPGRRMSGIPEGPEDRALDERCLVGGMLPLRGSAFPARIFQTPDHVVIHYEFVNATITVPLDDRPQVSSAIQQWTGTSRGLLGRRHPGDRIDELRPALDLCGVRGGHASGAASDADRPGHDASGVHRLRPGLVHGAVVGGGTL